MTWACVAAAKWQTRGSNLESLGLGLALLPISFFIFSCSFATRSVTAASVLLGLVLFTLAMRRRCVQA